MASADAPRPEVRERAPDVEQPGDRRIRDPPLHVGPEAGERLPHQSEPSERVPLEEFKGRLRKTLTFLHENDRPHWQTVVAENEQFLKSLETEPAYKFSGVASDANQTGSDLERPWDYALL